MRCLGAILLMTGFAVFGQAQDPGTWTFSGRLSGTANSDGAVLKVNPSVGYTFNKFFHSYVGLPYYIVRDSGSSVNGIGNAYAGLGFTAESDAVNFNSNFDLGMPTGDEDKGLSTGRVTVDWTNRFSRRFSLLTPFASVGLANTISDTTSFVRPFSSHGFVAHFDGGTSIDLTDMVSLSASAYAVRASGEQRIISRTVNRELPAPGTLRERAGRNPIFDIPVETIVPTDTANDHGFSASLDVFPRSDVDFYVGYNRSMGYDFNSVFFGIGFRIGK